MFLLCGPWLVIVIRRTLYSFFIAVVPAGAGLTWKDGLPTR